MCQCKNGHNLMKIGKMSEMGTGIEIPIPEIPLYWCDGCRSILIKDKEGNYKEVYPIHKPADFHIRGTSFKHSN